MRSNRAEQDRTRARGGRWLVSCVHARSDCTSDDATRGLAERRQAPAVPYAETALAIVLPAGELELVAVGGE